MNKRSDIHEGQGALTPDAFEKLLAALDRDRQKAGETYEKIRQKLVRFFEWRGTAASEELADAAIDRVIKKLQTGETIRSPDPAMYFYGVARNILREHWSHAAREQDAFRAFPRPAQSEPEDASLSEEEATIAERRLDCLERCLGRLPPEDRDLILRYYEHARHIEGRKALAQGFGIPINALRVRAFRLRAKLESCVEQCLRRSEPEMDLGFGHKKQGRTVRS